MKRLLSAGLEPAIKRAALRRHLTGRVGRILDLATGNGEVLSWLASNVGHTQLVGVDLSMPMLELAPSALSASLVCADLNALPLKPRQFDVVTVAYGIRYTEPERFLTACHDMLKEGGRLLVFDLSNPVFPPFRWAWHLILLGIGSVLGSVLHGHHRTYWHLVQTLRAHPGHDALVDLMTNAGFVGARSEPVLGGLMAVHVGDRKDGGPRRQDSPSRMNGASDSGVDH